MGLVQNRLDHGRTLFVDNWYTSFELMQLMLTRNTDLVGTLVACKHLPPQIKKKKKRRKIKLKVERIVFYETTTDMVSQWKDKKMLR